MTSLAALSLLAGLGLAASPSVQAARRTTLSEGAARVRPLAGPLGRVVYDLETGRITRLGPPATPEEGRVREPEAMRPARSVANCFLNTNTMGFFSTGTTDTEWRDWAGKATGKGGIVRQFYFAYATSANDVAAGGRGAAIEIAFYAGETGFCTTTGVEIARSRFCFTGLPGVSASLPTNAGVGFMVTAFAPSKSFLVPDGKLGWSYGLKDNDGSGSARTGPLMTSFVTANTCAADAFDLYSARPSSEGSCVGAFFFSGCEPLPQPAAPVGTTCASFYIGLGEDDGADAAFALAHDPLGCNAGVFMTTAPPVIGSLWRSVVSPVGHARCILRVTAGACAGGSKPAALGGTALYAIGPLVLQTGETGCGGGPGGTHEWAVPVPLYLGLDGMRFCAQSLGLDFGPLRLTGENAEELVVGTS